ncbi:MAG: N-acetyl-gamma-glutamyl-phosphate reductase [Anaerolineae bacterium]|nr:N-acetyl-gamma-glutamyl-phosphate reductase [Anaerolineae bacterium]
MVRVGIFGATGYTGYELVNILLRHPQAEIVFTTSESSAGGKLSDIFPCPWDFPLIGLADAPLDQVDVVFLCLPHGASMDAVRQVRSAGIRAIDLSADFRLSDAAAYRRWYGHEHTAPELLNEAVYGLPELHRGAIRDAGLVANPGCYPTSIILGLYPLVRAGALADHQVIADSKSGVSGAGRKPSLTTHFVEAHDNFSPYNIGHTHRHIAEMEQELSLARGNGSGLYVIFSPHLLPVNRGIVSTMYPRLAPGWTIEQVRGLYEEAYSDEPFIHLLRAGQVATLRHTVNTNRVAIALTPVDGSDTLIVTSSLDNLIKGASGQAVQNMNLMFGLDEKMGLM